MTVHRQHTHTTHKHKHTHKRKHTHAHTHTQSQQWVVVTGSNLWWWCLSLNCWHKYSTCTHGGFTRCNLHRWCFPSTHWRRCRKRGLVQSNQPCTANYIYAVLIVIVESSHLHSTVSTHTTAYTAQKCIKKAQPHRALRDSYAFRVPSVYSS